MSPSASKSMQGESWRWVGGMGRGGEGKNKEKTGAGRVRSKLGRDSIVSSALLMSYPPSWPQSTNPGPVGLAPAKLLAQV